MVLNRNTRMILNMHNISQKSLVLGQMELTFFYDLSLRTLDFRLKLYGSQKRNSAYY